MTGDGLGRGLSDMWRSVVLTVPTVLAFIAVLLIGWLVARLLRTAVTRVLHRAGLDRAVTLPSAGRFTPSELSGKLVFGAVLLFALQLAFGLWGANPGSALLTRLIGWLPQLLVAIVLVVVAITVARTVEDLVAGAIGGLSYGRAVARTVSVVIVVLGVIAALDQVRVAAAVTRPLLIAVLTAVAGVVIVGVGGGLIRPMQSRWETWLTRAAAESTTLRNHRAARTRTDETQVIPPPRHTTGPDETLAMTTTTDGTTIINPGPNDTLLIGSATEDTESTQVIPPGARN